jgi:hypothetical protein
MLLRPIARSVLCLMFVLAAGSAAAGDDWRQLQTPRYTIVSQLTDSQTRAWAGEFDEFIESVSGLLRVSPDLLPPLTVVLFAGDKQFDPYRPTRPNGRKASEVAGVFQRTATWSTIGLGSRGGAGNEETRRLVFHEALHWLLGGDTGPKPRWYHEGLAELFSTFQTKSGKVQWGHPIQGHLIYLQARGLMPLREFMAQRTSIFDRDEHSGQYYAQSWALVHFLLMGNRPERREQLLRFLAAYRTQSVEDAFAQSFGGDYEGLEKDLEAYVTQTRLFNYTVNDGHAATGATYAVVSAPPAFVQQSLGRVALGAADESLAKRHAARALELDPNGTGTHELRAYVARRDDDAPAALSAARAAIATGTRDAEMFVVAGDGTSGDAAARRLDVNTKVLTVQNRLPHPATHGSRPQDVAAADPGEPGGEGGAPACRRARRPGCLRVRAGPRACRAGRGVRCIGCSARAGPAAVRAGGAQCPADPAHLPRTARSGRRRAAPAARSLLGELSRGHRGTSVRAPGRAGAWLGA